MEHTPLMITCNVAFNGQDPSYLFTCMFNTRPSTCHIVNFEFTGWVYCKYKIYNLTKQHMHA